MNNNPKLLFSKEEYQQRVDAVRRHMKDRGVDLLLVDQTEFLFYLTGFGISENMYRAFLLPLEGEPVMVLRAVDEDSLRSCSWVSNFVTFTDWSDPVRVIIDTIESRGWSHSTIGIDETSYCMTVSRFKTITSALPKARFSDFSGVMDTVRARKSHAELEYIRAASRMADLAVAEVAETVKEGDSGRDVVEIAHRIFTREGGDSHRCGIFTAGVGNSFLHNSLQSTPLNQGDILHLEFLPYLHGYSARLMRPLVIGEPTAEHVKLANALLAIQDEQFAAMRPGVSACDIDAFVRKTVVENGLRDEYYNITGYSLGYYPISTPRTSDFSRIFLPNSDWVLEESMVFHMYISASGIAFSETVVITNNGIERLTQSPRTLI